MNNRRNFFKRAGLFGAVAVAPTAAVAVATFAPKENIEHLSPGSPSLTLMSEPLNAPVLYAEAPRYGVALSVGKDKRLWVQIDGKWKRVAVEE